MVSDASQMVSHPAYLRIVALGDTASRAYSGVYEKAEPIGVGTF